MRKITTYFDYSVLDYVRQQKVIPTPHSFLKMTAPRKEFVPCLEGLTEEAHLTAFLDMVYDEKNTNIQIAYITTQEFTKATQTNVANFYISITKDKNILPPPDPQEEEAKLKKERRRRL